MFRHTLLAGAIALAFTAPATAQTATTMNPAITAFVGVAPMTGVSATDYVKFAADADMYEI